METVRKKNPTFETFSSKTSFSHHLEQNMWIACPCCPSQQARSKSPSSSSPDNPRRKSSFHSYRECEERLQIAFRSNKEKQVLIREAEQRHSGEELRFYFAILEFERIDARAKKKKRLTANKIIATFVQSGAMYETGCLSSNTRQALLNSTNKAHSRLFETAKYELLKDIYLNGFAEEIMLI